MTPLNPHSGPPQGSSFVGFTSGLLVGLALLCVGGGGGYVWVKKAYADARRGWNLVPVVIAAVDIPEGTTVTMEMISQRSVPEQFVTSSVVKPDSASYVVGQVALVPMIAGDPLMWSTFEAKKSSKVLFLRADVTAGHQLTDADLEERFVADVLLTSSWVPATDRSRVLSRRVLVPFLKGDPMLWSHLDAEPKK